MTCRVEDGTFYNQVYNMENRLGTVQKLSAGPCPTPNTLASENIAATWEFSYDGDGTRVLQVYTVGAVSTTTRYYLGGLYEETDGVARKYYAISGMTVAMKEGSDLNFLLTDHLGSVAAITDDSGALLDQQRYMPFGAVRENTGTITQTDFGYTGQRNLSLMGLMDYKARFYDAGLGRFIQADTIIPNAADPQGWNRYAYVRNAPLRYTDPTGHFLVEDDECTQLSCSGDPAHEGRNREEGDRPRKQRHDMSSAVSRAESLFSVNPLATNRPSTGGRQDGLSPLEEIESLFNWSLTIPGEMTIFATPGYPILGGLRAFYAPTLTVSNGQPVTIGPTSMSAGSITVGYTGTFQYKAGRNSITALNIGASALQPWAAKVSVDITRSAGNSRATSTIGVELAARPDDWAYVGAVSLAVATYGLAPEVFGAEEALRRIPVR